MNPLRFSVIVPVFRRSRMIVECLECIAAQTRIPDRVVIVDDGSQDETPAVVADWIRRRGGDERFLLVALPERGGAASARNRGLEAAGACDYVVFLDSDDLWPADFLARAERALADDPQAVAATADIRIERPGRAPSVRQLAAIQTNVAGVLFRDAGIGSATCLRVEAVRACGGYDESLPTGHDVALFLPISALGRWLHLPGAAIEKRHGFQGAGEAGNLFTEFADRHRRWAELYERLIQEHGQRLGVGSRDRARMIARRWQRAGSALCAQRDKPAARACLRKAIRWRPASIGARVKLLHTYLS